MSSRDDRIRQRIKKWKRAKHPPNITADTWGNLEKLPKLGTEDITIETAWSSFDARTPALTQRLLAEVIEPEDAPGFCRKYAKVLQKGQPQVGAFRLSKTCLEAFNEDRQWYCAVELVADEQKPGHVFVSTWHFSQYDETRIVSGKPKRWATYIAVVTSILLTTTLLFLLMGFHFEAAVTCGLLFTFGVVGGLGMRELILHTAAEVG